jgi:hypothetical protein
LYEGNATISCRGKEVIGLLHYYTEHYKHVGLRAFLAVNKMVKRLAVIADAQNISLLVLNEAKLKSLESIVCQ